MRKLFVVFVVGAMGMFTALPGCSRHSTPDDPIFNSRAWVTTSSAELIPGPDSMGMIGDFALENSVVKIIIQQPGRDIGVGLYGGNPIDWAIKKPDGTLTQDNFGEVAPFFNIGRTVNYTDIYIQSDGSDGGAAVICANGVDADFDFVNLVPALPMMLASVGSLGITGLDLGSIDSSDLPVDPQQALPIEVFTCYTLEPNSRSLKMVTTITNKGSSVLELIVGDLIGQGGATNIFTGNALALRTFEPEPGAADNRISLVNLVNSFTSPGFAESMFSFPGFLAFTDDKEASYAYVPENELDNTMVSAAGVNLMFTNQNPFAIFRILAKALVPDLTSEELDDLIGEVSIDFVLQPGASGSYTRYVVIGDENISTLTDEISRLRGLSTGTVTGVVLDKGTGMPIIGARVAVIAQRNTSTGFSDPNPLDRFVSPYSEAKTDANGEYSFDLPEGLYLISAVADGRGHPTLIDNLDYTGAPLIDQPVDPVLPDDPVGNRIDLCPDPMAGANLCPSAEIPLAGFRIPITAGQTVTQDIKLPAPASVDVTITEWNPTGNIPIPAKITVFGPDPSPMPMPPGFFEQVNPGKIYGTAFQNIGSTAHLDNLPHGITRIVFTETGNVQFNIEPNLNVPGHPGYIICATRGPEYTYDCKGPLVFDENDLQTLSFNLVHALDTTGYISGDFHMHSVKSYDSYNSHEDKIRSVVSEGLDFFVATDHDYVTDYMPTIEAMGVTDYIKTGIGEEVTTFNYGHFNVFPLVPMLGNPMNRMRGAVDWAGFDRDTWTDRKGMTTGEIFDWALSQPGEQVIQINHFRGGGIFQAHFEVIGLTFHPLTGELFFKDDFNGNGNGIYELSDPDTNPEILGLAPDAEFYSNKFTALEVLNGIKLNELGARLRDWFNFLNTGKMVAAVGNSDSHTLIVGVQGLTRSYIPLPPPPPSYGKSDWDIADIPEDEVYAAINRMKIYPSSGPFIEFRAVDLNQMVNLKNVRICGTGPESDPPTLGCEPGTLEWWDNSDPINKVWKPQDWSKIANTGPGETQTMVKESNPNLRRLVLNGRIQAPIWAKVDKVIIYKGDLVENEFDRSVFVIDCGDDKISNSTAMGDDLQVTADGQLCGPDNIAVHGGAPGSNFVLETGNSGDDATIKAEKTSKFITYDLADLAAQGAATPVDQWEVDVDGDTNMDKIDIKVNLIFDQVNIIFLPQITQEISMPTGPNTVLDEDTWLVVLVRGTTKQSQIDINFPVAKDDVNFSTPLMPWVSNHKGDATEAFQAIQDIIAGNNDIRLEGASTPLAFSNPFFIDVDGNGYLPSAIYIWNQTDFTQPLQYACNDGIDNDGDGWADTIAEGDFNNAGDSLCTDPQDDSELW